MHALDAQTFHLGISGSQHEIRWRSQPCCAPQGTTDGCLQATMAMSPRARPETCVARESRGVEQGEWFGTADVWRRQGAGKLSVKWGFCLARGFCLDIRLKN